MNRSNGFTNRYYDLVNGTTEVSLVCRKKKEKLAPTLAKQNAACRFHEGMIIFKNELITHNT